MNPLAAITIAGFLLAGAAGSAALTLGGGETVSFEHTGSIPLGPQEYRLAANGEAACAVIKGLDIGEGLSELTVGRDCVDVLPDMAKVRYWKEELDGSIAFTADGEKAIVTFGIADGADYESFRPVVPVITLAAVR